MRGPPRPLSCAGGATEARLNLEAGGNVPPGELLIVIVGSGAGYVVCTPFSPVQVSEPWVGFELPEIQAELGQDITWTAKVNQGRPFEGSHQVRITGLPKGVTCEAQPFASASTEVAFPVKIARDAAQGKHKSIYINAVIEQNGEPITHGGPGAQEAARHVRRRRHDETLGARRQTPG